jgi:hypothetical protein
MNCLRARYAVKVALQIRLLGSGANEEKLEKLINSSWVIRRYQRSIFSERRFR